MGQGGPAWGGRKVRAMVAGAAKTKPAVPSLPETFADPVPLHNPGRGRIRSAP